MLGVNIFDSSKNQIIALSDKNKISTSQNIVSIFSMWVDERINSLNTISKLIENSDILNDKIKINAFISEFVKEQKDFDLIQVLNNDGRIFINGEESLNNDFTPEERLGLIWFVETKYSQLPTVNFIKNHNILKKPTLNLCVPIRKNGEFCSALCGVVKLENLFNNISKLKLIPNSYIFIVTHAGEILTPMEDERLKSRIETKFKEMFLKDDEVRFINLDSNFISLDMIVSLSWYVGAGMNNESEINDLVRLALENGLVLLFAFITLAFLANGLHNFMYKQIKDKQDEYEILLAHKTKMSEAGELISGINHQFIQPVNSINLMITTLLMLQSEKKLDDETLETMLTQGQKSVGLLSDTIEIFRNFYKTSENIESFSINQSVKNLISLMHTELTRANVRVVLNQQDECIISQKQNIIQQILLILIHNAKDAVVDKFSDFSKREILINISFDEKKCYVIVRDFGVGISLSMRDKIFSQPKTTKTYGNGFGLYFGKKLAREKINGDIKLLQISQPTIFELSFDRNLKV